MGTLSCLNNPPYKIISACNVFHLTKVRECKIMWSNYAIKCCYYFFSPLSQSMNSFLKAKNCQQKIKCTSWVTSLKPMKFPEDWGWCLTLLHSELGKPQEYQYIFCLQLVLICISRTPQFEILKIFYNPVWNRRVPFHQHLAHGQWYLSMLRPTAVTVPGDQHLPMSAEHPLWLQSLQALCVKIIWLGNRYI